LILALAITPHLLLQVRVKSIASYFGIELNLLGIDGKLVQYRQPLASPGLSHNQVLPI
jgi:hypothetical protein